MDKIDRVLFLSLDLARTERFDRLAVLYILVECKDTLVYTEGFGRCTVNRGIRIP